MQMQRCRDAEVQGQAELPRRAAHNSGIRAHHSHLALWRANSDPAWVGIFLAGN